MGTYLNPGNSGFERIVKSSYVDKTDMISIVNQLIGTTGNLLCVSRPRRFGKSFAAQMLCAYYDKTCDSSNLFSSYVIAQDMSYPLHLNHYDVIYLDMTNIIGETDKTQIIPFIRRRITEELLLAYPALTVDESFSSTLINAVELAGNKIIMIIDEWDAPIREVPELQKEYLEFLRTLFKSSGTTAKIFAAVYMTGILPIKKDGSQSAISDFDEYTMIKPRQFAPFVGFTDQEVRKLCKDNDRDYLKMKEWYDGYSFRDISSVYNPNSVMKAVRNNDFDSYWAETSAAESLLDYISMDYDGLSRTLTELLGGGTARVNTLGFANDLTTFRGKDDVLTLLIHLGYLAYDEVSREVRIPNEEIRIEFAKTIRSVKRDETIRRLKESDQLIDDVLHLREEAVADQIENIHSEESSRYYNNEQSLRSVIKRAFFCAYDDYVLFEELPAGDGIADVVYLPKRTSQLPVLIIELKWNQSAEGAIHQIKDKNYPEPFESYGGDILLVGISYQKDAPAGHRKHTCKIEKIKKVL